MKKRLRKIGRAILITLAISGLILPLVALPVLGITGGAGELSVSPNSVAYLVVGTNPAYIFVANGTVPPVGLDTDAYLELGPTPTSFFTIGFGSTSYLTIGASGLAVSTTAATGITATQATLSGNITALGSDGSASSRGFIWDTSTHGGTTGYPNNWSESGAWGTGTYTHLIASLSSGITYYYRAVATDSTGARYGSELSFTATSSSLPTVTTGAAANVLETSAILTATLTSTGSSNVTVRGFQYGLTTAYGSLIYSSNTSFSAGFFFETLTTLSSSTLYHYRAYATNSAGTAYGNDMTVTTISGYPLVQTTSATNVSAITATLNGFITNTGGADCTVRGFVYGTSSGNYSLNTSQAGIFGTGAYNADIASLTAGTTYYVKAYATNSFGTGYGLEGSFVTQSSGGGTLTSTVTNLRSNPTNTSMIVTWTKASGSTNTIVRYSTASYPATPTEGSSAYSGTGFQTTITGLTAGQAYFISAWGLSSGNYSASATQLAVSTLAVLIPNGSASSSIVLPTPTLPANINVAPSTTGFQLEPFTSIVAYFTNEGLGMPVNNTWMVLAIVGIVLGGLGTYIKVKNFFVAFFVVFALTILAVGLHVVQGWLVPIEIVTGLAVWAIDKYLQ